MSYKSLGSRAIVKVDRGSTRMKAIKNLPQSGGGDGGGRAKRVAVMGMSFRTACEKLILYFSSSLQSLAKVRV